MAARIDRHHADGVDTLGDEVLDDLRLHGGVGLRRALLERIDPRVLGELLTPTSIRTNQAFVASFGTRAIFQADSGLEDLNCADRRSARRRDSHDEGGREREKRDEVSFQLFLPYYD